MMRILEITSLMLCESSKNSDDGKKRLCYKGQIMIDSFHQKLYTVLINSILIIINNVIKFDFDQLSEGWVLVDPCFSLKIMKFRKLHQHFRPCSLMDEETAG